MALAKIVKGGKWPLQKKPKGEDLIEVFVSKSTFFRSYQPHFPRIRDEFPVLHHWLVNDGDVPTDQEAWGFRKTSYMFNDLDEFVRKADGKKRRERVVRRERMVRKLKSPKARRVMRTSELAIGI